MSLSLTGLLLDMLKASCCKVFSILKIVTVFKCRTYALQFQEFWEVNLYLALSCGQVKPNSMKEAYESWCSWEIEKSIRKVWEMVPAAIFWGIWNERNCRCFDEILTPTHQAKCFSD
ncbi:hypothetical protein MTR67_013978 [Solanum verrucosum]|uniref:Uncharacterized protein n=1 Tax=Solanum verrucosum TaxID=315347 RepID=A0AAF0QCG9_SOLVR|nr:hypothetical protein MTR67_013978 [Solanum verrucosum]